MKTGSAVGDDFARQRKYPAVGGGHTAIGYPMSRGITREASPASPDAIGTSVAPVDDVRTDRSSLDGARPHAVLASSNVARTPAPAVLDRRDHSARAALLRRVAGEFDETPALRLTAAQARRLFALREDICARVLAALVEHDLLEQDAGGLFVRACPNRYARSTPVGSVDAVRLEYRHVVRAAACPVLTVRA